MFLAHLLVSLFLRLSNIYETHCILVKKYNNSLFHMSNINQIKENQKLTNRIIRYNDNKKN